MFYLFIFVVFYSWGFKFGYVLEEFEGVGKIGLFGFILYIKVGIWSWVWEFDGEG